MSSKFFLVIPLTYIPFGILSENGEDYASRFSVRTVRTSVGAKGRFGRTEGLPEVQKPLLEYTAKENDQQVTQGLIAGLNRD